MCPNRPNRHRRRRRGELRDCAQCQVIAAHPRLAELIAVTATQHKASPEELAKRFLRENHDNGHKYLSG